MTAQEQWRLEAINMAGKWCGFRLHGSRVRDVLGDTTPIPVIIQAEDGASLAAIKSDLATIVPGASAPDTIFRFLRVVAPSGFVSTIAQIPGVRVVSYDAPVWMRQAPTMIDPLLGTISVSAILSPTTMGTWCESSRNRLNQFLNWPILVFTTCAITRPFSMASNGP